MPLDPDERAARVIERLEEAARTHESFMIKVSGQLQSGAETFADIRSRLAGVEGEVRPKVSRIFAALITVASVLVAVATFAARYVDDEIARHLQNEQLVIGVLRADVAEIKADLKMSTKRSVR